MKNRLPDFFWRAGFKRLEKIGSANMDEIFQLKIFGIEKYLCG
jgi:hypothetical protein